MGETGLMARRSRRGDFVSSPAQVTAQMQPFIELSVDRFLPDCGDFPSLATVETLIDEELPALNR